MKTYQKVFSYSALSGAAIALLVACGKPADNEIKIGHVAPITGSIAHLGKQNENGALLAVEEINKAGLTINGKKVVLKLVPEDDAADPKTATQVAQKLVDAKVVAVVGHLNSGTSIPASKIYSDAGISKSLRLQRTPLIQIRALKQPFEWSRLMLSRALP